MSNSNRNLTARRGASWPAFILVALIASPALAAPPSADPGDARAEPDAKPKRDAKAKPTAKRSGVDATARRAAAASRARRASEPGERIAMRKRTAPAAADDGADDGAAKPKPKKKRRRREADAAADAPTDDAADRKISLDEDFLVEGKLEKPNAFYILRRSQSGYDWARLDAKFLPLVLESVQDPLF